MLHTMAGKIAFLFVQKSIVPQERVEIYSFGLELLIATAINGVLVLISALVLGVFWQTILLLAPFFLIRRFAGGYHAGSHIGCMAGFLAVYWVCALTLKLVPIYILEPVALAMLTAGAAVILLIGAIAHENRPVDAGEYKQFRRKARVTSLLLLFLGLTGMHFLPEWFIWFSFGLFIAAGSLLAEWIKIFVEGRVKHDKR